MATTGSTEELFLYTLIEAITEPGREARLWETHFSLGQRVEIWLHRCFCAACRKGYPLWRKSQLGLWQRLALKQEVEKQEDASRTIGAAAARQLQSLAAKGWPSLVFGSKENIGKGPVCDDLTHQMWDAYLDHIRRGPK